MWGCISVDNAYIPNFSVGYTSMKSDVIVHLAQWQYWWWFWFSFLWGFYYLTANRVIRHRFLKFRPKIYTSFRSHGKWGDFLACVIPTIWCLNILTNSSFILRLMEWQNESSLFTIRVRARQWYWIYKFELRNVVDIITVPRNVGSNRWVITFGGAQEQSNNYFHALKLRSQNTFFKKYWNNQLKDLINNVNSYDYSVDCENYALQPTKPSNLVDYSDLANFDELYNFENRYEFNNVYKFNNLSEFGDLSEFIDLSKPDDFHDLRSLPTHEELSALKELIDFIKNSQSASNDGVLYEPHVRSDGTVIFKKVKNFNLVNQKSFRIKFFGFNFNIYLPVITTEPQEVLNNTASNGTIYEFLGISKNDKVEPTRLTKKIVSETQPILVTKALQDKKIFSLLNINFNVEKTVKKRLYNDQLFLTIKQKRYKVKKFMPLRIKYLKNTIDDDNPQIQFADRPFLSKNSFITNLEIEPTKLYQMLKKNKVRSEAFSVQLSRRLLRTRKTLVLPAHVNLTLITNSYDVVHSWFLPGLGVKLDCVPGRSTHHTFYSDSVGFFYGQCAEICGRYHHHMPIRVCMLPYEHFFVWWQHFGLPKLLNTFTKLKYESDSSFKKFIW